MERKILTFVSLISLLVICSGCGSSPSVSEAEFFLETHFNKLKQKKLEEAYDDFSIEAKKVFSFDKYVQLQKIIESKLGELKTYKRINWRKTVGVGSRPSSVTLIYKTAYSKGKAINTFVIIYEKGQSKIYYYNINSAAFAVSELQEIFQ